MKCPEGWVKSNKVGSGHWAKVYRVCCGDDCRYIMKQYGRKNFNMKDFVREVKIQTILAKAKIAPMIHHVDKDKRIIVMDALQLNFVQFVQRELEKNTLLSTKQKNIRVAVQEIIAIIKQMHRKNIAHNDLEHGGNIMMNAQRKWLLIDFGISIQNANEIEKKDDFDQLWNMMFTWAQDSRQTLAVFSPTLQIIDTARNNGVKRENFYEYLKTVKYPPGFIEFLRKSIREQM